MMYQVSHVYLVGGSFRFHDWDVGCASFRCYRSCRLMPISVFASQSTLLDDHFASSVSARCTSRCHCNETVCAPPCTLGRNLRPPISAVHSRLKRHGQTRMVASSCIRAPPKAETV